MKKIFTILCFLILFIFNNSYCYANYDNSVFYNNRGNIKYNKKDYKGAINDYSQAIAIHDNVDYYYSNRANAKFALKDYNGAIQDFSYAIELNPKDSYHYFNRGAANNNTGKYIAALDDYKISYNLRKNSETQKMILGIKQDFKNPNFLIQHFIDITNEIGVLEFVLFLILLYFNFYKVKERKPKFKVYTDRQIEKHYNFDNISLDTPPPAAKNFNLESSRIDYLEEYYKKEIVNTNYQDNSGIIAWYAIIASLFLYRVIDVLRQIYTEIPDNTDMGFIVEFIISFIISYRGIINISKIKTEPDITEKEYTYYLLYKGVLQKYKERITQIREEEENKRRKQRSYWKDFWENAKKDGFTFEQEVGNLYNKLGYSVSITKGTGDGGVDIILTKDNKKTVVQCKAHTHQVGPNDVRALWGVREDFGAQDAIFVAYSGVTNGAYEFTKGKKYKIVDVNDLINLSIKVNSEDDT